MLACIFFPENHYTWRKVNTIIRNLYVGKMYIEQEGEMDIINHTTGERCHLKYTCGGMFSRDRTVNYIIFYFFLRLTLSRKKEDL